MRANPEHFLHPDGFPFFLLEFVREFGVTVHSLPQVLQVQTMGMLDPAEMSCAVIPSFFSGISSFANSGWVVARSLNPISTLLPEQYGQPCPLHA